MPAAVARHQRPFGGGEWHVEVAVRVFAADAQRASEADRHLGDTDEVLHVAGQRRRVDREVTHMAERWRAALGEEVSAPLRHRRGVVVVATRAGSAPWNR